MCDIDFASLLLLDMTRITPTYGLSLSLDSSHAEQTKEAEQNNPKHSQEQL